jgi:5'-3' exonuclease
MIIVDLNQVMIANIMAQLGNHTNTVIEEDLFRHVTLNSLRSFKRQFAEYGEMVIACDDKNYWRKQQFPYYKANRKKAREKSDVDWNQIFNHLNKIREELKIHSPYRVIQVDGVEADDIIATLCIEYGTILNTQEKILILSGDKDFVQLQVYGNVEQYNPVLKKHIKHNNPHKYLREHILKGDRGDGIPNIMSADDCIAIGERQKSLPAKKIEYLTGIPDLSKVLTEQELTRFKRNERLIDLHMIPEDIRANILKKYHEEANKPKDKLVAYLKQHKLKVLLENIGEF